MRRLSQRLDVPLTIDAGVRADEPDGVHTMRSTARRLPSLLRDNRRVHDGHRPSGPVAVVVEAGV